MSHQSNDNKMSETLETSIPVLSKAQLRYIRDRPKRLAASKAYYEAHREERKRKSLAYFYANQERLQRENLDRYYQKKADLQAKIQAEIDAFAHKHSMKLGKVDLTQYFRHLIPEERSVILGVRDPTSEPTQPSKAVTD